MIQTINTCCIQKALPLAFDESLSYLEQLCALLNKLNETIEIVNKNTDLINNININFDAINNAITKLNTDLANLEKNINDKVTQDLNDQYNKVLQLMNDYQIIFNQNLTDTKNELNDRITEIELGNVMAYDPTTGENAPVSEVILNIYDALRNNSITVSEFESLELSATEFDNKQISAYNFDVNGKTFLLPQNVI